MQSNQERIAVVVHQHVALRHDVLDFLLLDDGVLLQHFDRIHLVGGLVLGKKNLRTERYDNEILTKHESLNLTLPKLPFPMMLWNVKSSTVACEW